MYIISPIVPLNITNKPIEGIKWNFKKNKPKKTDKKGKRRKSMEKCKQIAR